MHTTTRATLRHVCTVNTLYDEFMAVLDDEFMKCKRIMRKMIVLIGRITNTIKRLLLRTCGLDRVV